MTSYNSTTSNQPGHEYDTLDQDVVHSAGLLSSSFAPSSWSGGSRSLGVAEVIASYRRSQYLLSEQAVISSGSSQSDLSYVDLEGNDQEASNETLRAYPQAGETDGAVEEEPEDDEDDALLTPIPAQSRSGRNNRNREDQDFVGGFAWDDVVDEGVSPPALPPPVRNFQRRLSETVLRTAGAVTPRNPFETAHVNQYSERTPLLRKTPSRVSVKFQVPRPARPRRVERRESGVGFSSTTTITTTQGLLENVPPTPTPVANEEVVTGEKVAVGGQSTFGQTLFNSIAILLGFGMLSEPLAFAYAGWIGGLSLIVTYGLVSCYTAKILSRIMLEDPRIVTYADIGKKAFGPRSTLLTSILFCLELFAVSVVLVTLLGDSLNSIDPTYSTTTYKLFGFLFLLPTVFFPLSVLSYTSILGILSTILIIAVMLFDGLTKPQAPGSLWDPMDTSLSISTPAGLGVAFGLFMAGFSGHAVLPSLAKDMVDPREFDKMIDWAFGIATVLYALIGSAGYMMFGNSVSDEVSRDMLLVPGYNRFINQMAVWSLVVLPLTKFALTTRPVNVTLEIMLGISNVLPERDPHAGELVAISDSTSHFSAGTRTFLMIIERTVFATLAVAVSILIPEFSSMMAFLGSFSAFMLGIIGPVSAKIVMYRKCSIVDALCLSGSVIMAVWGTLAVFVTSD